jgi:hypothetical protein
MMHIRVHTCKFFLFINLNSVIYVFWNLNYLIYLILIYLQFNSTNFWILICKINFKWQKFYCCYQFHILLYMFKIIKIHPTNVHIMYINFLFIRLRYIMSFSCIHSLSFNILVYIFWLMKLWNLISLNCDIFSF